MPSPPNILFIMSDQHSPAAFGAYGAEAVRTPNLDRLAAEGVLFRNAYCNSPICGPSRWSLLTGEYVHEHGAYDNGATLSSDEPTFAHALTRAGYETVLCSRMHIHGFDQYHGFEKRLATECNNPIDYPPDRMRPELAADPKWGGVEPDDGEEYVPVASPCNGHDEHAFAKAKAYLASREWGERPFLLVASFVAPHPYLRRRPEYLDLYREYLAMDLGAEELDEERFAAMHPHVRRHVSKGGEVARAPSRAATHRMLAEYFSRVTYFDAQVGELLDTLEAEGLRDDTVVFYTSDHGDDMGRHGYFGKTTFFEHVAGVPLIVSEPGGRRGAEQQENVSLVDLLPTLCDVAEAEPPPSRLAGGSLMPLARGDDAPWRNEVLSEYFGHYARACAFMLRRDDWKLNHYVGESPELFDLAEDPDEGRDLAADPAHRETLRALEAGLRAIVDPEATQEQVLLDQSKRQFIAESTQASVQTKQRLRAHIQEYRERWNEPTWDDNERQGRYETHLQ